MFWFIIRKLPLLGFCIMTSLGHAQQKGSAASNSEAKERELDDLKTRAAQGVPQAQVTLGKLYAEGDGPTKNPVEAVRLWKLAAALDGQLFH
jgi:TPR repeat protein